MMMQWWEQFKRWLVRDWLAAYEERLGAFASLPCPPEAVLVKAREYVARYDTMPDKSGEYKRHQVYALLMDDFPGVSRRVLGLAVEVVVCGG